MSKKLSITKLREYAFNLRCNAMDDCIKAHELPSHTGQQYAAMKERADTKRKIANELDSIINGEY